MCAYRLDIENSGIGRCLWIHFVLLWFVKTPIGGSNGNHGWLPTPASIFHLPNQVRTFWWWMMIQDLVPRPRKLSEYLFLFGVVFLPSRRWRLPFHVSHVVVVFVWRLARLWSSIIMTLFWWVTWGSCHRLGQIIIIFRLGKAVSRGRQCRWSWVQEDIAPIKGDEAENDQEQKRDINEGTECPSSHRAELGNDHVQSCKAKCPNDAAAGVTVSLPGRGDFQMWWSYLLISQQHADISHLSTIVSVPEVEEMM